MLCKIVLQKLISIYENSSYTKLVIDCAKLITVYEYVLYSRRARIQLRKTLGPLQLQRSPQEDQLGSLQHRVSIQVHCPFRFLWTLPPQPTTHTSIPKILATPRSGHRWHLQGPSLWPFERMGGLQQWLFIFNTWLVRSHRRARKSREGSASWPHWSWDETRASVYISLMMVPWAQDRQEEKGTTEDEMVGWHHRLDGHEFG